MSNRDTRWSDRGRVYEIRDYESHLVAGTTVEGDYLSSGRIAFRRLAGFIFGCNSEQKKMNMTVPVVHRLVGDGSHRYQFMLERSYTEDTLPTPIDDAVEIRRIPAGHYAALGYRGGRRESHYLWAEGRLLGALARDHVEVAGPAFAAVHSGPATPPIMRRNEVLVPVAWSGRTGLPASS